MKKNYSNPKFKFVLLDSNDLICTSNDGEGGWTGITNANDGQADAKRRPDIWDE